MSKNRKVIWASALALGVIGLVWYLLLPPEGFLTGIYPVDGRRSVFLMRYNGDDETRTWVGLVDVEDGLVWDQELPAMTYSTYGRHGVTVADGRVTVKVSDGETHDQVLAYALADGSPLWTSEPLAYKDDHRYGRAGVLGERPYADSKVVLYSHGERPKVPTELVARDPSDGTTQWTHKVKDNVFRAFEVTSKAIVYRAGISWFIVDRADGKLVHKLDEYSDACIDDTSMWTWSYSNALMKVDLSAPGMPVEKHVVNGPVGSSTICGRRGETLVFFREEVGEKADNALVGIDPASASVLWSISLGPRRVKSIAQNRDTEDASAHPLRGGLTDFVPVILSQRKGLESSHRIAVINLRDRKVAWESKVLDELLHHSMFRGSGGMYYLTRQSHVVAIDGASGKVTAAVAGTSLESVRGFHAVDGRLWVYNMDWLPMNRLPWAVLDGRTLKTLAQGHKLGLEDVMEETIQRFGIPREWVAKP